MRISKQGLDFIKSFEGLELKAYWDKRGGVWTIGWGKLLGAHTVKFMCVRHLAEFFGTEEHVLRAKIEELKDNNCPLFR